MNKRLLSILAVLCCACPSARADNVDDVKKAFDTFVQYSKTADKRLLDLFAPEVSVTVAGDTGKGTQDMVIPTETFRQMVQESIDAKDGDTDTYADVKCVQDGDTVKLTCTRTEGDSGKPEPFLLIYAKDASGHFTIKALKMTVARPQG